jgi:tRNA (guanine10-N2)-dimethyltransferase
MEKKRTYFCYLSGELQSTGIPSHEVIAILKSNGVRPSQIQVYDQVLLFTSNKNICELIIKRAAYVHQCGEVIFNISDATPESIEKEIRLIDFNEILKEKFSFVVRIKKIKSYFKEILEEKLEKIIGDLIKTGSNRAIKVNLRNPECHFLGIFTEKNFIFGIRLVGGLRNNIKERAPHTRPFFHPCGLDPFLARAMINLSEINPSKILFDPFCGSGSILIEAALMGFKVIGSDINLKLIKGANLNLRSIFIQDFYIVMADARNLPLREINCIVTDPPYGRSTRIELGRNYSFYEDASVSRAKNLENLLSEFFRNTIDLIEKGNSYVMAVPSTFEIIYTLVSRYNLKIQQKFDYYVHNSLTRNIMILKKM